MPPIALKGKKQNPWYALTTEYGEQWFYTVHLEMDDDCKASDCTLTVRKSLFDSADAQRAAVLERRVPVAPDAGVQVRTAPAPKRQTTQARKAARAAYGSTSEKQHHKQPRTRAS